MFLGDASVGSGYSVTAWVEAFSTPIACPRLTANQRLLSGPSVIPASCWVEGVGYSLNCPPGVSWPILSPNCSVNQRSFPGPTVIPLGMPPNVGTPYSVILPLGVTWPMRLLTGSFSENHRFLSGPVMIWTRSPPPKGSDTP